MNIKYYDFKLKKFKEKRNLIDEAHLILEKHNIGHSYNDVGIYVEDEDIERAEKALLEIQ